MVDQPFDRRGEDQPNEALRPADPPVDAQRPPPWEEPAGVIERLIQLERWREAREGKDHTPQEREVPKDPEIEALNEAAEKLLPIDHVDYRDFDPRLAREITDNLQTLTNRYPEIDCLRWVSTIQERDRALAAAGIEREPPPDGVYAEAAGPAFGEHAGIAYNDRWSGHYDKLKESLAEDVSLGWHPPGTDTPSALLTHEFGHMIDHHLEAEGARESHISPVLDEICMKHPRWIAENVSGYAAGERGIRLEREVFAEAFAEFVHSDSPRPVARRIGEAIDSAFEDLRSQK